MAGRWPGTRVGEGNTSDVGELWGAAVGASVGGMAVSVGTGGCVAGSVGGITVSVGTGGCVAGSVGGITVSVGGAGCAVGSPAVVDSGAPARGLHEISPRVNIAKRKNAIRCIEDDFNRRFRVRLNDTTMPTLLLLFYLPAKGDFPKGVMMFTES